MKERPLKAAKDKLLKTCNTQFQASRTLWKTCPNFELHPCKKTLHCRNLGLGWPAAAAAKTSVKLFTDPTQKSHNDSLDTKATTQQGQATTTTTTTTTKPRTPVLTGQRLPWHKSHDSTTTSHDRDDDQATDSGPDRPTTRPLVASSSSSPRRFVVASSSSSSSSPCRPHRRLVASSSLRRLLVVSSSSPRRIASFSLV